MAEFSGIRSHAYKECLREFPRARDDDIEIMKKYLAPKENETILEVGAGSGFFSRIISDMSKKLIVSDPSKEQLEEVQAFNKKNIKYEQYGKTAKVYDPGCQYPCLLCKLIVR